MSEFSELLEKHILNAGLTEEYLSQTTGFSRSYVARLKNGQRVSPDTARMTRLFDSLRLSEVEYRFLWELYQKERLGADKYNLNREIIDFILSFHQISRIASPLYVPGTIPDVSMINGRADIEIMLRSMIFTEASRRPGHIRLLMQTDCRSVNEDLRGALKNSEKLRVDHLVCLEPCQGNSRDKFYNIRLLRESVPVLLSGNEFGYHLHYHYDSADAHFNSFSMIPYVMITSDCVACMDVNFEHMVIHREKDICDFYREYFDVQLERCPQLFDYVYAPAISLSECSISPETDINVFCMAAQPCLGFTKTEKMLEKYLLPGAPEALVLQLRRRLEKNRENMKVGNNHLISYFSEEGVDRFLREGKIDELPELLYRPLEKEDRKNLLWELIHMSENGQCQLYLMEKNKINYPRKLILNAYSYDKVFLTFNMNYHGNCISIEERSLAWALYEFLYGFWESSYALSAADTVKWLKKRLEEA